MGNISHEKMFKACILIVGNIYHDKHIFQTHGFGPVKASAFEFKVVAVQEMEVFPSAQLHNMWCLCSGLVHRGIAK